MHRLIRTAGAVCLAAACIVFSVSMFTAMAAAGEGEWLPLATTADSRPAAPTVTVREARADALELDVRVPGLWTRQLALGSDIFADLTLEDGDVLADLGRPRLPVIRRLIEVPRGAAVQLHLEPASVREWTLASLGLPSQVLPVQPPIPKLPGADAGREPVIDESLYASASFWPAPHRAAAAVDHAVVRGRDLVLVELRPVSFHPALGVIRTWSSARLTVHIAGGDPCAPRPDDSPRLERLFHTSDLVSALPEVSCPAPDAPDARAPLESAADRGNGGAEGMLVFVADAFESAIEPLVDWKRKTGFKVEVVTMSDLGGSPADTDIKNHIQNAYETWTDPPLGFVLMVGDTDFTPIHQGSGGGNSQVTDNWYACVDGSDYLPDLGISRISTRSAAETSDVVDKLLTYQQATFTSEDWTKRTGFIGTSDSGHIGLIEGTHDDCIDMYYTPNAYEQTSWSHGYASCDRHYNSYDADTSEIAASIDEGRAVVNYSGHGSQTSWQGPTSHGSYDQSDVRNNTNAGMYPFVISNACVTGTLNRDECFGETWQKVPSAGAIAFLGASNNSYWDEDDYYQRALHDHIFPMDDTPPISIINNRAKLDLYNHYGNTGTVAYYYDMYNMLSEPSLSLWTRRPRTLTVEYDSEIPTGTTEFTVTVRRAGAVVEGELVAVRKLDENIFAAGYTDASGKVTLPLDPAPMVPGALEVTVTGHDDRPHEGTSEVIPVDGPYLRMISHAVDDSEGGCDADGVADIGENALFTVTLENIGTEDALETRVWLSSASDVAVLDNPVFAGTILADQSQTVEFTVRIGAGVSCEESAVFDVHWEALDSDPGDDDFVETLEVDLRHDHQTQDFEHGGAEPADWTHYAIKGTDDWSIVDGEGRGGGYAYHASGTAVQKEIVLDSEVLHPEGDATLTFWHRYELTDTVSGAWVEFSANGGASWQDLEPYITEGGYNAEVGQGVDLRNVWNGNSGGYTRTSADLTPFAGQEVRLRFHLGSMNGSGAGWWIDDVDVESVFVGCDVSPCGVPLEVTLDDVSREGDATRLTWWDDPVALHYAVRRGDDPADGGGYEDVTHLDDDDTDGTFLDDTEQPFACWLIGASGPDGDAPWNHYSW